MSETAANQITHRGTVHAGRVHHGQTVPACMSGSQLAAGTGIHFSGDTDKPVTCRRCQAGASSVRKADAPAVRAAKRAKRKAEDVAAAAELRVRKIQSCQARIERLATREAEIVAAGGADYLDELRADLAGERDRLAAL